MNNLKNIYTHFPDLISIVHAHATATPKEIENFPLLAFASISGNKADHKFAWCIHNKVCGSVL